MTLAWLLNTAGLFATTVGTLLIFLYLLKTPRSAEDLHTPEGQRAYAKQRRLLVVGVGLLAVWLVIQYLAILMA